jgi:hypothetical protein
MGGEKHTEMVIRYVLNPSMPSICVMTRLGNSSETEEDALASTAHQPLRLLVLQAGTEKTSKKFQMKLLDDLLAYGKEKLLGQPFRTVKLEI